MPALYPSLIAADLLNLETTITKLDPHCAGYHIDIMDNHFVPNLTWGHDMANAIAHASHHAAWVHLMVTNPKSMIERLILPLGSTVSFHIESTHLIKNIVELLREKNVRPGIAISPKTDLSQIFTFTQTVDHVLLMSVEPGLSGQPLIPSTYDRLTLLAEHRQSTGQTFTIGIDGGITTENIPELVKRGANDFAIATAIFGNGNPVENLHNLTRIIQKSQ